MKNKAIFGLFTCLILFFGSTGIARAISDNGSGNGYDAVTYDDSISFSATMNANGSVSTSWSKYAHAEEFTYYKVIRSKSNPNPVYPDDGYIYYSGELNDLSYTDDEVPRGTVYYRVCQIASPKRYCSKVVTLNSGTVVPQNQIEDAEELDGAFVDVSISHWADGCLKRLSGEGVISGNPDGTYRPNNPINRAEFTKLVILAMYPDLNDGGGSGCFGDVKFGDWYSPFVCAASELNIVSGYTGNVFRPAQSITRAEAVSVLIKSLELPMGSQNSCSFGDVMAGWQRGYVNTAKQYQLVNGYGDGSFKPNNTISRAEAAQLVCNAMEANISEEDKVDSSAYETPVEEGVITEMPPAQTNAIIVDHRSTDLSKIPVSYIESAKNMFRIAYGHTSHGSQLTTGMEGLKGASSGSTYYFSKNGDGGLYYNEDLMWGDLGSGGDLDWADQTRDMLDSHSNINMVMWSWCGGQSDNDAGDTSTYLNAMNQLEQDYPDVTFVYMTGHLDGTGEGGNLHQRNEQIRNYVRANNKVLFDFADIESYDPSSAYFLDKLALDSNEYDSNGDGNPWGDANWADDWCAANPGSDLCESNSCAHSTSLNCNLKGRAFWWMMARLAGWDGN